MNRKMVFHTIGHMVLLEAVLLVIPLIVALIKNEITDIFAFTISIAIALLIGCLLRFLIRPKSEIIYAKEGFLIAGGTWIVFSAVGALPFVISGAIPSFTDAFFETVSGLTTTGATILDDVEVLSKSIQFWRCFTHWIGGMGVIVFVMAILPNVSERSIHIMRAEMPGISVDKLVPRATGTAKILYLLYIGLTTAEFVFLVCGEMTPYEALLHSFSTAGTGGYGLYNSSVAGYSAYSQWVITVFMTLFGVNFNLYFLIVMKKIGVALKNTELRAYYSLILGSTAIISISLLINNVYNTVEETIRHSAFQVASFVTTTGFTTDNYDANWTSLAKGIMFVLMFIGGCAGSTGGGFKVARLLVLLKSIRKEFKHLLHPRSVNSVKLDGKSVENAVVHSVNNYFAVYMMCVFGTFLLVSIFDNFGPDTLITNLSASVSCFNNVGPAFGWVGSHSYSEYSIFSKYVLSIAMLMGRLEIYPILLSVSALLSKGEGKAIRVYKNIDD